MCRPTVLPPSTEATPFIKLVASRHACVVKTFGSDEFIPNDVNLGCDHGSNDGASPRCLLLTGPNMGGKSTLMRQVSCWL